MATDLLGHAGRWAVPKHCFLCMRRAPYGGTIQSPTMRVHGTSLFMHVCDGHEREAQRVVGEPNVITRLTGAWITSDELERENEILRHQPHASELE